MEESRRKGVLSNSKGGFQIWTLGQWSGTLSMIVPSPEDFFCVPLVILAHLWGLRSLEGMTSPSSTTSLPFLSNFLFLSTGLDKEVWMGRGIRGQVWMTTLGTDPPAWDSRSSSQLVFGFLYNIITSGTLEDSWALLTLVGERWLNVAPGDSGDRGWLKALKSSSESKTSTTLTNSSRAKREEVDSSSA